jgi:hypothetical protein
MKSTKLFKEFTAIILIAFILSNIGCNKDDNENSDPEINDSSVSYSGEVQLIIDSLTYYDLVDVSFTQSGNINGSYFQFSDGKTGIFSGSKNGNTYNITGNFADNQNSTFSGSINVINNSEIQFEIIGNYKVGDFRISGILSHIPCRDLKGNYFAHEQGTITIQVDGETVTETIQGSEYVELFQQNCQVSYFVPATNTERIGEINADILVFSGDFIIPNEGVEITKNEFNAEVRITDKYDFTFTGNGVAEGTYEGASFKITGSTQGTFKKQFDLAVGLLRGGPIQQAIPPEFTNIQKKIIDAYPNRVIVKCFPAINQYDKVIEWLDYIETDLENDNIGIILSGHSLGADVLRRNNFDAYNLFSRISIDPINRDLLFPGVIWEPNQRSHTWNPLTIDGTYYNYLADHNNTPYPWGLLGHLVYNANESELSNTNHLTIVDRIDQENIVLGVVNDFFNKSSYFVLSNPYSDSKKQIKGMKINTLINNFDIK